MSTVTIEFDLIPDDERIWKFLSENKIVPFSYEEIEADEDALLLNESYAVELEVYIYVPDPSVGITGGFEIESYKIDGKEFDITFEPDWIHDKVDEGLRYLKEEAEISRYELNSQRI